jgi:hypothetical protein
MITRFRRFIRAVGQHGYELKFEIVKDGVVIKEWIDFVTIDKTSIRSKGAHIEYNNQCQWLTVSQAEYNQTLRRIA